MEVRFSGSWWTNRQAAAFLCFVLFRVPHYSSLLASIGHQPGSGTVPAAHLHSQADYPELSLKTKKSQKRIQVMWRFIGLLRTGYRKCSQAGNPATSIWLSVFFDVHRLRLSRVPARSLILVLESTIPPRGSRKGSRTHGGLRLAYKLLPLWLLLCLAVQMPEAAARFRQLNDFAGSCQHGRCTDRVAHYAFIRYTS